ncbi:hypothetical protein R1sor_003326 [Riccia sorocarpa]|uniref:Mitochondrial import inner membrane translocase subunit TIM50 n=1 Tax=Riccia sorocarpa TaxID=122646 RepID=A0ABD3H439_9MARC
MLLYLCENFCFAAAFQKSVIRQRAIEDIGTSSGQPLQEEVTALEARRANLQAALAQMSIVEDPRPKLIAPDSTRSKVLILDLNGLLVRVCKSISESERSKEFGYTPVTIERSRLTYVPRVGLAVFLDAVKRDFTLIIWTSRTKRNADVLLLHMEENGFIPPCFFQSQDIEVWTQLDCTPYVTTRERDSGGTLFLKSFARLYDYNLATRDVLLVDDSVAKNSTNSPFSALHPPPFTPWTEDHVPHRDQFLLGSLLPWLQEWRASPIPTPSYIRLHLRDIDAQDPIEGLRSYWGPSPSREESALLFHDATVTDRGLASTLTFSIVESSTRALSEIGLEGEPEVDDGAASAAVADA